MSLPNTFKAEEARFLSRKLLIFALSQTFKIKRGFLKISSRFLLQSEGTVLYTVMGVAPEGQALPD